VTSRVALAEVAAINPSTPQGVRARDGQRMVPFLPMSAVSEEGNVAYEESRPVSELLKGYTYFQRGDVLLAKITPCLENGKAASLSDLPDEFGFGSTEFHVLRPGPEIDPRYLFHSIWNNAFRHAASNSFTGSAGQKRLPASFFDRYRIPLPPLAEQRRIAAILDKADGIRRKRRESIKLLDEFLRSAFLEMFGDSVRNEKGWDKGTIGDVVTETRYGTGAKANSDEVGLPVLRMNNLTSAGAIDRSSMKWCEIADGDLAAYTVRRGDLLFNRTNSPDLVGKTAVWDRDDVHAFAGYLIRVRFDESRALPDYVSSYLNSTQGKRLLFEKAKPSNNMSNISASELRRLPVLLPPLAEQQRYAHLVAATKQAEERHQAAEEASDKLFESLAQRAFGVKA
jgi:type I restriction enzyme S subunit